MQHYKLDPEQYKKVKKKVLAILLPIAGIILTILIITQGIDPENGGFNIIPVLVVTVVFCGLMWFLLNRTLKRQKDLYDSYRLTIHDNLIVREQLNTPTMEIYTSEISSMTKTKDCIIIKGKTPQDVIYIPIQMENFDALERRLEEFMLIAPVKKQFLQRYFLVIYFLAFASMIVSLTSFNIIVVAACGIPVIVLLVVFFSKGMQSKNIDSRTKRRLWSILLVCLLLIANIIYKWIYYNPY